MEPVLIYKFPQLSREEIEAMFTLDDLRHSRVYQEAQQEGLRKGLQDAILRLLSRKLGQVAPEMRLQIETPPQLEKLTEALLDFASVADLESWMHENT